jgi:hypothetical protein
MASAPRPGWLAAHTTMEGRTTTVDLVNHALRDLQRRAGNPAVFGEVQGRLRRARIKQIKVEVKGVGIQVDADSTPETSFDSLVRVLHETARVLTERHKRLLLIWDEFPDAIRAIAEKEGRGAAADMMAAFRGLREAESTGSIRWILCGSIGFHHVLRELRSGFATIDDLGVTTLGPLTADWSRWLAACLLRALDPRDTGAAAPWLADASDGIPYILELMVKTIAQGAAQPADARAAGRLLVSAATGPLTEGLPLLERVSRFYGDTAPLANTILDRLAEAPRTPAELVRGLRTTGMNADVIDRVIELLTYDHYIRRDGSSDLLTWTYPSLMTIWRARRGRLT